MEMNKMTNKITSEQIKTLNANEPCFIMLKGAVIIVDDRKYISVMTDNNHAMMTGEDWDIIHEISNRATLYLYNDRIITGRLDLRIVK